MKTFNEGDRVNHPRYGAGTVVHPYEGTGSTTVQFDTTGKIMTETAMLSLVPQAPEVDESSGLYLINVGGNRVYRALSHQITLAIPEPKFNLTVTDTEGWSSTVGPHPKNQIDALLTGGFNWDTVDTVTINRVKG